jgi:hypothetical protein
VARCDCQQDPNLEDSWEQERERYIRTKAVGLVERWRSRESLGKQQRPAKEKSEDSKVNHRGSKVIVLDRELTEIQSMQFCGPESIPMQISA